MEWHLHKSKAGSNRQWLGPPASGIYGTWLRAGKMSGEFGTGKTIFVLAIVVGCFAVLWPKIFYPMLLGSVKQPIPTRQGKLLILNLTKKNSVSCADELSAIADDAVLLQTK